MHQVTPPLARNSPVRVHILQSRIARMQQRSRDNRKEHNERSRVAYADVGQHAGAPIASDNCPRDLQARLNFTTSGVVSPAR